MRLAKYLANAGICSRRRAEEYIVQGRVKVNGAIVREKSLCIDPAADKVDFDSSRVRPDKKVYLLLNKPSGYISSVHDPWGRPTVVDLINSQYSRVYPVGRLDFDTEGLLLLTNDGDFANRMIHPRYQIKKRYEVRVKGSPGEFALQSIQTGIELEDGITAPAKVKILKRALRETVLEIEIHEGRKRQIKRMFAAMGHKVLALKRTGFAFLNLNGVPVGSYRELNPGEISRLYNAASRLG